MGGPAFIPRRKRGFAKICFRDLDRASPCGRDLPLQDQRAEARTKSCRICMEAAPLGSCS